MGYLGNTPGESFISFAKQVFTIVNSQTAYTLDFSVVDENELRLVVNSVVQEPGSGKAYTASGTTLTLSAALTNGTDEMYCVFLGKARETVTVPTITKDKLNLISTSSSAGLEVKGDGTTDGTLQLNCSQNSHGIKLASPPHSAGQSYTLTFPQSISADTFLKTDGSGNLSFASAGGTNTPYFYGELAADATLTRATTTKVTGMTNDELDSATAFDGTTFTVPSGQGGKYYIEGMITADYGSVGQDGEQTIAFIYKNGSEIKSTKIQQSSASGQNMRELTVPISGLFNLSASDTIELYAYIQDASGSNAILQADYGRTSFMGYKIIE